jgi:hypothetical protein
VHSLFGEPTKADYCAGSYENLHERIKYIFANCTHPDIMSSVSNVFKIAMHQESARNIHMRGSSSTLSTAGEDENHRRTIGELEEMGMSGLGYTFLVHPTVRRPREHPHVGHAVGGQDDRVKE